MESTRGVRWLKQFGIERSGTNVINVVCRKAFGFNPLTNTFGRKHDEFDPSRFKHLCDFGFLISIRDPYAWLRSYLNWLPGDRWRVNFAAAQCKRFNRLYRSWSEIENRQVIRHEFLMTNVENVVARISEDFGLPIVGPVELPKNQVLPNERVGAKPFDSSYYLERRYLDEIPSQFRHVVTDLIDWSRLAPYYEPE